MTLDRTALRRRILDISYRHKLSHLGSCLTSLDCLIPIFAQEPERFVLSCGHAGLALYVVLEALHGVDAEELLCRHGIHPCRDRYIDASTGSLGMGITLAVGMALAGKETHVLLSDGECSEGSVWEALAFKQTAGLKNLHVYVNMNGYSALSKVNESYLWVRLAAFDPSIRVFQTDPGLPFLHDLDAHYHVLSEEEYHSTL